MPDDHAHLDDQLAELEAALRGDHRDGFDRFLAFDGELTRYMRGEERLVFPVLERFTAMPRRATARMRSEHRSLRRLLDTLGEAIARGDAQRGLDVLATLRSVLLLHVTKEEWMLSPLMRAVAS